MKLSNRGNAAAESATMAISAKAKKMKADGIDVINFGVGEPDFDTPRYVRTAAKNAIDAGKTRYTPVTGILKLRNAICASMSREHNLQYTASNIVVSSGAKAAIYCAMMAVLDMDEEIIIPTPCWVSYPEMAKLCGAVPVELYCGEESGFLPDPDALEKLVTPKTRAILINNPCNPTGARYDAELLTKIAQIAKRHDLWVISDEIYDQLTYDGESPLCFACISEDAKERAILINGASKTYAMTGWRIGWAVANDACAKVISNIQSQVTSCANSVAQYAVAEALVGAQCDRDSMRQEYERRRDFIWRRINMIQGLSATKPAGAFYLFINIKEQLGRSIDGVVINDSMQFCSELLERYHVAAVPGSAFGADGYIRICYALDTECLEKGASGIENMVLAMNAAGQKGA